MVTVSDYALCNDELDDTTNASSNARRALETGYARLTEIPENLKGEEAGEERAAWLTERLPDIFKNLEEGQPMAGFLESWTTTPPTEMKDILERIDRGPVEEGGGQ